MIASRIWFSGLGNWRSGSHDLCGNVPGRARLARGAHLASFVRMFVMVSATLMSGMRSIVAAPPLMVATGTKTEAPRQPQLAIAPDKTVHLIYGQADAVYYAASTDQGRSFSKSKPVFSCPNMSLGMRRGPRIAMGPAGPVVTAIGGKQGKGRDGDILVWGRSENGEWKKLGRVNEVEGSAREGLHNMTAGIDGQLWCCWLDLRSGKTELYGARSADGGSRWETNRLAYRSPDGSVCECCHPSIVADPQGHIHVLFRNQLGGNRDMYVVSSEDGETFGSARSLSRTQWMLNACPMDGGMIAVAADGAMWSSYRQKDQIYLSDGQKEISLGRGEQPTVACLGKRPLALWTTRRVGDLMLGEADAKARRISPDARDPVIVAAASGAFAIVAWEGVNDAGTSIRVATVP
jgi:hypothetical protein